MVLFGDNEGNNIISVEDLDFHTTVHTIDDDLTEIRGNLKRIDKSMHKKHKALSKSIRLIREDLKNTIVDEHSHFSTKLLEMYADIDNTYQKKVKCVIRKKENRLFLPWVLYINDVEIGNYCFKFSAKRAAKEYADIVKRSVNIKCNERGNIISEEFIL